MKTLNAPQNELLQKAQQLKARISAGIAAIGTERRTPRYYAESDGDEHRRTFYVLHTCRSTRIDCTSMKEARELAQQLNETGAFSK